MAEEGVTTWKKILTLHDKNLAERGTRLDWEKCKSVQGACCSPCFLAFLFSIAGAILLNIFRLDALSNGAMTKATSPNYNFYAPVGDAACEDLDSWACFYTQYAEIRPKARLEGLVDVDDIPANPAEWDNVTVAESLRDVFKVLMRLEFEFSEDDDDALSTDYVHVRADRTCNYMAGELLRPRPDTTAYTFGPSFYMPKMTLGVYWEIVQNVIDNTDVWQSLDLTNDEMRVQAIQYMLPTAVGTYDYDERLYNKDVMSVWISFMLTWILGFVMTRDATKAARFIMEERQNGTKQLMEFLGLNQIEYWGSQFYTQMMDQVLPVFVSWLLIFPILNDVDEANDLDLGFTHRLYILFLMFNLVVNVALYAFACSSLVRKDSIFEAWSLVSSLMFCFIPVIVMISRINQDTARNRLIFQFIPLFNFAFGVRDSYTGINFDTVFFHFFNTLFWGSLTFYFDLTVPTLKGAQTKRCCFCCRRSTGDRVEFDSQVELSVADSVSRKDKNQPLLVIKDLRKDFGDFTAVNEVCLELETDQIYGLLGFNGAGKTTTINMITGQLKPTDGKIEIDGHDVAAEIENLRKIMGVCPQMNILWSKLTVMDHIQLFGRLRGFNDEQIAEEADALLRALEMDHRKDNLASSLSGGEKRKLMVSAAFLGDPPFILLDEPTAGVDIDSRDCIQQLILDRKKDKLIILTTHHMSEADYLADDIGIMADGQIAITGTPTQLKVEHGKGTTFLFKSDTFSAKEVEEKFDCDVSDEDGYVKVRCNTISEVPDILKIIESHVEAGQIKVDNNSLESVFLNLAMQRAAQSTRRSTMRLKGLGSSLSITSAADSDKQPIQNVDKAGYGSTMKDRLIDGDEEASSVITRMASKKYTRPGLARQFYLLSQKRLMVMYKDISPILRGLMIILFMAVLYIFFMNAIGWRNSPEEYALLGDLTLDEKIPVYGLSDFSLVPSIEEYLTEFGEYKQQEAPLIGNYEDYPQYGAWKVGKQPNIVTPSVLDSAPQTGAQRGVYKESGEFVYVDESTPQYVRCVDPELLSCTPLCEQLDYASALQACKDKDERLRLPTGNEATVELYLFDFETKTVKTRRLCADQGTDPSCAGDFWTSDREEQFRTNDEYKGFALQSPYYIGLSQSSARYQVSGQDPKREALSSFSIDDYTETLVASFFFMLGSAMMVVALFKYTAIEISSGMFEHQELMGVSKWLMFFVSFLWDFAICLFAVVIYILITNPNSQTFNDTLQAWCAASISFIFSFYAAGAFMDYDRLNTVITALIFVLLIFVNVVVPLIDEALFSKVIDIKSDDYDPFVNGDPGPVGRTGAWFFRLFFYFIPPLQYITTQILYTMTSSGDLQIDPITYVQHWCLVFPFSTLIWIVLFFLSQMKWKKDPVVDSVLVDDSQLKMQSTIHNVTADTMSKVFNDARGNPLVAVNRISFEVTKGRCTGVLGKNGAGKSTMMNMLSTLFPPTAGRGKVHNKHVVDDIAEIRSFSGICNQKNIYWKDFTVREHLTYFGQLRGVPSDEIVEMIHYYSLELKFIEHMDTKMDELSGGNKRKVALCTSIIGAADVLFLDEPSAGVDPFARDEMKNVLVKLKNGRTVLFTSHTMEEAEIMCDDVVIMVKGNMEAEGEVNQLITDYSKGYTLQIDISSVDPNDVPSIREYIEKTLENVTEQKAQKAEVIYNVAFEVKLSDVFIATASLKEQYGCESIIESSNLGQLFKHVVREEQELPQGSLIDLRQTYQRHEK